MKHRGWMWMSANVSDIRHDWCFWRSFFSTTFSNHFCRGRSTPRIGEFYNPFFTWHILGDRLIPKTPLWFDRGILHVAMNEKMEEIGMEIEKLMKNASDLEESMISMKKDIAALQNNANQRRRRPIKVAWIHLSHNVTWQQMGCNPMKACTFSPGDLSIAMFNKESSFLVPCVTWGWWEYSL